MLSATAPLAAAALILVVLPLLQQILRFLVRGMKSTALKGPASLSRVYGCAKLIGDHIDASVRFATWAKKYGNVYRIPTAFGTSRIAIMDPTAIAHIYKKDTFTYRRTDHGRINLYLMTGKSMLWAEAERHKQLRNIMLPGFTVDAIRSSVPTFFEAAYTLKAQWDGIFDAQMTGGSHDSEVIIDVCHWLNCVTLDIIGNAGCSYGFEATAGKPSEILSSLEDMSAFEPSTVVRTISLLSFFFPPLLYVPTARKRLFDDFKRASAVVGRGMMEESEIVVRLDEKDTSANKSVLRLLSKAYYLSSGERITGEEALSQLQALIAAGFETTSVSLTWALAELGFHIDYQDRLRNELLQAYPNSDPTFDEYTHGLPYLNAVVHETLRLHCPTRDNERQVTKDDVVPLSTPIQTASGEMVDRIHLAKGEVVIVPMEGVHRLEDVWGADALEFKPERWMNGLDGLPDKAKEYRGEHHLLTFIDGPRKCMGRHFALAEFKAVLSVLIRNFIFEMRDGPDTKLGNHRVTLLRPTVLGETGAAMPMRVKRVET